MEPSHFDTVVRHVGRGVNRRGALTALLGALPAALLVPRETAGKGNRRRGKGKNGKQGRGGHVLVCHSGETLRVPRYAVHAIKLDGGVVGACPPDALPPTPPPPPQPPPPPTSCDPATKQWSHRTNFGGSGFGPNQFGEPRGLAVSGDGQTVWVTDVGFDRLSVWTEAGGAWAHQTNFGNRGSGPSQFRNALGTAVSADGQTAWVADTDNHRLSVWAKAGNTWINQTAFGSLGADPDRFDFPSGVAVSEDGQTAWVADSRNHRISVWTKAGSSWTNLTTFGSRGDASSQFNLPSGVAVSADGLAVWVADLGNDRVSVWRKSGSEWFPQTTFGSRGSRPNQFNNPFSVAVSADGQAVWVADLGNERISVWIRSGSDWTNQITFGSRGNDPSQFRGPSGVAVSADGQTVWAADQGNARISVWALTCPPALP